jgi:hypothetical protein
MNIQVRAAGCVAANPLPLHHPPWLLGLPRRAWAWELLRRNPQYHADFAAHDAKDTAIASRWGLLQLENPLKSSLDADTFWCRERSRDVLHLVAQPLCTVETVPTIDLAGLKCRSIRAGRLDSDTQDILFADGGRALQVTVAGSTPIQEALLLTPVLPMPRFGSERLNAVRRFTDLVRHGWLRPSLYPAERSAKRYAQVLLALDGWLDGRTHREIAIGLFGRPWVDRAWNDSGNHLRDRVRRAIRHGRDLMGGHYRRFLS